VEDEQLAEAPKFSREMSSTRHRTAGTAAAAKLKYIILSSIFVEIFMVGSVKLFISTRVTFRPFKVIQCH